MCESVNALTKPVNALTVDVEDWYQGIEIGPDQWGSFESRIGESLPRILDLFAERNTRGTFFILGWIAERYPDLVRRIAAAGHQIGTHGYSHRLVYRMERSQFEEELRHSIHALEDIAGCCVDAHRAPFFSITKESLWALDALQANGIKVDSSIFPVRNYRYGIPDSPRFPYWHTTEGGRIAEFPLSTVRIMGRNMPMAGGFYLRALPYPILRRAVSAINKEGRPAIIYIHPWEVDPEHPRIPLPKRIALTHYYNLRSTEGKLRRLLREFAFAPLGEITAELAS
jgi:polysaccharide deacetylase family protein (PEP-CTERM system associated)